MRKPQSETTLLDIPVSGERVARYRSKAAAALAERGAEYVLDELAYNGALVESLHERLRVLETVFDLVGTPQPWNGADANAFPSSVTVSAEMVLDPADGFHKLDHDSAGNPYRWTGPHHDFTFYLNVNRSGASTGSLNIASFSRDDAKGMQCFVDGRLVSCDKAASTGSVVYSFALPPTAHTRTTSIRFSLPQLWHPRDRNPESKDDRWLGVAFQRLSVAPAGA